VSQHHSPAALPPGKTRYPLSRRLSGPQNQGGHFGEEPLAPAGTRTPNCGVSGLLNPLNAKLNPICHLLAMLGAHPILHVSRLRVNLLVSEIKKGHEKWPPNYTLIL